ncbi:MAG: hypothetical protein Greene041619_671 [Candidatus Peregrinibacteria bacterium Greene0416_19]|nr:MAG: hypothetical protein Greene041619_671 [Candidatus Peregrinibacteria bacterium Greene0416_19]
MPLTPDETTQWEKRIVHSEDPALIRQFFPAIGKPEQVRVALRAAVADFARHDLLLQQKFEKGVYSPDLSDEEISAIALERLKADLEEGSTTYALEKLQYPVYTQALSLDERRSLVNRALYKSVTGREIPSNSVPPIIGFPDTDRWDEVKSAHALLKQEQWKDLVDSQVAHMVINARLCHMLIVGEFSSASRLKAQFPEHYREESVKDAMLMLARRLQQYEDHPLDDVVFGLRSEFRHLIEPLLSEEYRDVALAIGTYIEQKTGMIPTPQMDAAVERAGSETLRQMYAESKGLAKPQEVAVIFRERPEGIAGLHHAFDVAEAALGIIAGMRALKKLLTDTAFVEAVGVGAIRECVNERIGRMLTPEQADNVYAMLYGTSLGNGHRLPGGVPGLLSYLDTSRFAPDEAGFRKMLLGHMTGGLWGNPERLLSDEYDFSCDNLTFDGTCPFDNAYELLESIRQTDGPLVGDGIKRLVFLKMAAYVKETYEGSGMQEMVRVYEDPANEPLIDNDQIRRLLMKVLDDHFEKGRVGGFMNPDLVTYFYTLVSSTLGELVRDDERLAPYFRLHEFLTKEKVL